jgi:hypothetical protein
MVFSQKKSEETVWSAYSYALVPVAKIVQNQGFQPRKE